MAILGHRFTEALCWAHQFHAEQLRKSSGVPYVSHVLAVASLVIENGASEDEAIAALLHDAAEDCGGRQTLERIRDHFGSPVADIVLGCSDTIESPKPPWRQRKESHLIQLATAQPSIQLVSIADKLHNLRTTLHEYAVHGEQFWSHFHGGREGTLWYFGEIVRMFLGSNAPRPLIVELNRTWEQLRDQLGGSRHS